MQNLLDDLTKALLHDERLTSDGALLKNKVVELALTMDTGLLSSLLAVPSLKKHFFADVGGTLVFDKDSFHRFVSNKELLKDSFTAYKNHIGLADESGLLSEQKNVVLVWPYKDCILEGGQTQEDAKRAELFWNETLAPDHIDRLLAPKVLSGFRGFNAKGEQKVKSVSINDNLIIKGNNLLALHTLKATYSAKVKVIYIDPPYNPDSKSNTFCYNNSFNRSTWLTFMQNRLNVAKELLRTDGVLIVAIDENEQAHLGVLLKDMFPQHEVHCVTIVHNPRGVQGTNFSYTHEYAFFVIPKNRKSIGNRKIEQKDIQWRNLRDNGGESLRTDAKTCFYPIIVEDGQIIGFGDVVPNDKHPKSQAVKSGKQTLVYPIDPEGIERKWRYGQQTVHEVKHLLRAKRTKEGGYEIEIGKDFGTYRTVWQDARYDANEYGTKLVKSLVPGCKFDFPKSLYNVYDCLYAAIGDDKEAIVLDFFAGSGTTAHAVLALNKEDGGNRKFILCEQMHYVDSVTVPRVHKVIQQNGAGSFVYASLHKANEAFMEELQAAKTTKELKATWHSMRENAFLSYRLDVTAASDETEFDKLSIKQQRQLLVEMLDKNMLYVPLTEIADKQFGIDKATIQLNASFSKNPQE